jgi:hypothetical protein
LNEPSFRSAARHLGDLVAADAKGSTVVQELEAAASNERYTTHHARPEMQARAVSMVVA